MMGNHRFTRREAIMLAGGAVGAMAIGQAPDVSANPSAAADYSLQKPIPGLHIPKVVTVVGCGGFGAWPALFAAMAGVQRLKLFDPAKVDSLDLARAPFTARHIGKPKVEALKQLLAQLRPDIKVQTFVKFFTVNDVGLIEGVLFEGTNDMALARELPSLAAKRGFTYVTGFYKGSEFGVTNSFLEGQKFESGKAIPVWVGSAAMSGLLAVHSAFLSDLSFAGSVVDLNMPANALKERISSRLSEVAK